MKRRSRAVVVMSAVVAAWTVASICHAEVFCIRGTRDAGVGWAWRLTGDTSGKTCGNDNFNPPTVTGTSQEMAGFWQLDIVANCTGGGGGLAVDSQVLSPNQATLNCPTDTPPWTAAFTSASTESVTLCVGPAGGAPPCGTPCNNGGSGDVPQLSSSNNYCNFNPDVTQALPNLPAVSPRGKVALGLLVLVLASVPILVRALRASRRERRARP